MTLKQLSLIFVLCFFLFPIFAQHTNIQISSSNNPEEPSIFIDQKDPTRIVAGANISSFYYSDDAGYTWTRKTLESSTFGVMGDPALTIDTLGNILFFHLSNPPSPGYWIDRIVCQRSTNNGESWTSGAGIGFNPPKQQDKEWMDVDRTNNNIYVTWTEFDDYGSSNSADSSRILFSKSVDDGLTFSEAKQINRVSGDCFDNDNTTEGAVPAVGPNGEIYVAWAGPAGIVFDRSFDQGENWLANDILVNEQPTGWTYEIPGISRCNGLPVTCCDISGGENNGTIYVNWSDQRNGEDDTDIWLSKSTDGGDSWSEAVRINDDPAGKQQFFTWMCVDQSTGYLWFVFYDRRNYDDNQTDVFMACSKDGGETFTNFKISESPFLPNSSIFFGDYNNISASQGVVRPIWTRLENTSLSIWTAIIDTDIVGVEQPLFPVAQQEAFPNPFSVSTTFAFKLKEPSHVSLSVNDSFGREITKIHNNSYLTTKKHFTRFNPADFNLNSGVYYFVLSINGQQQHKKIIYVKP